MYADPRDVRMTGPGALKTGALKTEPSSQPPQGLAIAHLVGATFEPGMCGQEDFLATHPSDKSDDCWPGTAGHLSDPFDYFPMQGPGLPFQTAPQRQYQRPMLVLSMINDDFNSYAAGLSSKRAKVEISPFSKAAEKTGLDEAGGMSDSAR
jgi:hypothetical protein